MLVSEILNKDYILCDYKEREKSVIYKEVDVDNLLIMDAKVDEDNVIEIVDPEVIASLI